MLGGFASPETNIKRFDLLRAEIENRGRTFDPVIRAGRPDLDATNLLPCRRQGNPGGFDTREASLAQITIRLTGANAPTTLPG
jgi:hypothetical protein